MAKAAPLWPVIDANIVVEETDRLAVATPARHNPPS